MHIGNDSLCILYVRDTFSEGKIVESYDFYRIWKKDYTQETYYDIINENA